MNSEFHDHFSPLAGRYAGFRPRYPAALFDHLATLVAPETVVWDCAAGSGQASVDLAQHFSRVVATDASEEQIAAANPHPKIDFRVALAEQSGLADAAVGLITVAQAVHWFDLPSFYAEVHRVLQPDGVLAVWCYGLNEVEGDAVNERVQHFYTHTLDNYWPPERRLVEAGYRTLPFPWAELPAPPLRIELSWTLQELLGYFSSWSATNRYITANKRDPLVPLAAELAPLWGDPERPRRVTWPISMRIGRWDSSTSEP